MKQYFNNIRSVIILLLVFRAINFSQTTSDLEIKNTKPGSTEPKITITPQGNFSTNVPSEVGTITDIEPGALKIEKVPNNTRMTLSEEKLAVEGSINEGNISDPVAGDMIIGNQAQPATVPQAIIGTSSGLSVTNTFNSTGGELLSAVAYVDNSVYEMNPGDAGFVYKYSNIGGEGKIHADNSIHYYVKDHLGSTRRVLDETFNDVEVIAYQAYGNQITLQTSSEDETRDNFTGKELDKEGSYTSIDFDLTINNCTGRDVKIKIVGGEGTTEIKPNISVIGNTVLVKSTMTFYESKYIIALIIQIPDNTPAINYLQETPEIYPSIKLGSEVKITLTENAADLATTMPPNGGFFVDNQSDAYVGLRLNYFGARYLDPDVGGWTSTDPNEQFWSGYSYGMNPINAIDPNGLDMFVIDADNRTIQTVKEEFSYNNYYMVMSGGAIINEYYLDLNSAGQVEFPASGPNWNSYNPDPGGDHYLTGKTAAALFGLLAEYESKSKFFTLSLGDMSNSTGGAPPGGHQTHGGPSGYSGKCIDYRYLSKWNRSFQGNSTSRQFSALLNSRFLFTAGKWGFNKNYASNEDVWGGYETNARRINFHNNHGHLTYGK